MLDSVTGPAEAARATVGAMAAAADEALDRALVEIADRLRSEAGAILTANAEDLDAATDLTGALRDRLRLDADRLAAIEAQVRTLAELPHVPVEGEVREHSGLRVTERRIPIGVVGANYEARPNVTVDVASQLVKSRNAGVLRTGGAALRSSIACVDLAIAPGLAAAGLPADAIQIVRTPDRAAAEALVSVPDLIRLVILRGSGPTTAHLADVGARHGTRILAHAEGGGVLYVDRDCDEGRAVGLVRESLDRLGVCNRLNLLLLHRDVYDSTLAAIEPVLSDVGVTPSLAPHEHPLGHEWATDSGNEANVTVVAVGGPEEAADVANEVTSGLAAGIATDDRAAAEAFLGRYRGTGAFWNASTRWLDGFKLLQAPETGINVDSVPGPRGPVTYRDLHLRQWRVVPAAA
ncbi:MAG TPA: aldehyde dehydrogenase family protein [Thermoleophilaceae bacterium]|nr:aldehyde dehydrogenase family protein [Thermoleophilaceae bacterium]